MQIFARLLLLVAGLAALPFPGFSHHAPPRPFTFSRLDRVLTVAASNRAQRNPEAALHWLQAQLGVRSVALGADRSTLDIWYRDGGHMYILPNTLSHPTAFAPVQTLPAVRAGAPAVAAGPAPRAVVLEPFIDQFRQYGFANEGKAEVDSLTAAGFKVDSFSGSAVTVPIMETLGSYSLVFMETHSGLLPNGDAIVALDLPFDAAHVQQFAALRETRFGGDGSLTGANVQGTPGIFVAFTTAFVQKHVGPFLPNSLVFINGCNIDGAYALWGAFHDKGVAATLSWHNDISLSAAAPAGQFIISQLVAGRTLGAAVQAADDAGIGVSLDPESGAPARLTVRYDTTDSVARITSGAAATNTPTLTATPAATPTSTATLAPVATTAVKRLACRPGHRHVHGKCRPCTHHPCKSKKP